MIELKPNEGKADEIVDMLRMQGIYPILYKSRYSNDINLSDTWAPEIMQAYPAATQFKDKAISERESRDKVQAILSEGPTGNARVNEHLTLDAHQQVGREIASVRERFAFYYDTRTGKTPMSLAIIHDDLVVNPTHRWLVLCPLILIKNAWMEDCEKFFPGIKVVNCHASSRATRLKRIHSDGQLFIMNVEAFASFKDEFENFDGLILDESSALKSPKTDKAKSIVEFAHTVKRCYLLSGTPAPNGEWEYYMQLKCIDKYSVPVYSHFKNYFFDNVSYVKQYEKLVLKPDKRDELLRHIKRYALYVDKEDVLDTPGRTFVDIKFDMPQGVMDVYKNMQKSLAAELSDNMILADSAAIALNKLNQISSGFIMDNDGAPVPISDYRFEELLTLLARFPDEQVLIWCTYRYEFRRLKELLGDRCVQIYGATSASQKDEAIRAFKSGEAQYLVANPLSADKGLTLTNAHIAIYFSLSYSYETFKQSIERIYGSRRIQPHHCMYYVMQARKSIDSKIYNTVLKGKEALSYAVLDYLKGGAE